MNRTMIPIYYFNQANYFIMGKNTLGLEVKTLSCLTLKIWGFEFDLLPSKVNSGQKYVCCLKAYTINSYSIFDFKVSWVSPWPSTFKSHLGSKKLYYSKAHIWLPIWLLWTPSLYLVPFSRYSTSKFLGFDLDLWPLKVIWDQKSLYHSKANICPSTWLLWTTSLYLVPFSIFSTSKFIGFDLDLWPLKAIWGQKFLYHSKAYIWLPIWLLWSPSLYLVPFSIYSTSKCLGFDLDLWPLKVIWGQKMLYHSEAYIWLPNWLPWTTTLYLLPFSRYSTSKFLGFDLDLWPLNVI